MIAKLHKWMSYLVLRAYTMSHPTQPDSEPACRLVDENHQLVR